MNIKKNLAINLYKIGAIKFGEFKMKSGMMSPIYITLRILVSHPKVLKKVAEVCAEGLKKIPYDRMAAVPYTAMPIVGATSLVNNKPWIYPRREIKEYGVSKLVEGEYEKGDKVVLVDDLITTGASKLAFIKPMEELGLKFKDVFVLIDREQGGEEELAQKGYKLHSIFKLTQMLDVWREAKIITNKTCDKIKEYLKKNKAKR